MLNAEQPNPCCCRVDEEILVLRIDLSLASSSPTSSPTKHYYLLYLLLQ